MAITRPPPDALMFKEDKDGFTIGRVLAHRIGDKLKAGWVLIISEPQMRMVDLDDTYRSDLKERR
jgi:hypothetical protein